MLKTLAILTAILFAGVQIYDYVWLGYLVNIPAHAWELIKASFFCWFGWHILQKIST
jgi:hypothetical protein